MTVTDNGTPVPHDWLPLSMANGMEWACIRRGKKDRFDCLYRTGLANQFFWWVGALSTVLHKPGWITQQQGEAA